eukprot:5764984-Prymnesium_polylepis.1
MNRADRQPTPLALHPGPCAPPPAAWSAWGPLGPARGGRICVAQRTNRAAARTHRVHALSNLHATRASRRPRLEEGELELHRLHVERAQLRSPLGARGARILVDQPLEGRREALEAWVG